MPAYRVVTSTKAFHYEGPDEFEAFKAFHREFYKETIERYPEYYVEPVLNDDDTITYLNFGVGTYPTLHPGQWFPASDGSGKPESDAEYRQATGPLPAWE